MESFLRCRDLPGVCRVSDVTTDPCLQMIPQVTNQSSRARALLLNTFEDLEGSIPPKSVIYVSFGSVTVMTKHDLMEFWYGLVNSKQRFLWVIRPDLIAREGDDGLVPAELAEATSERGYMVGYAPQEQVLDHPAVGRFLTHSGWNSTVESIVAGLGLDMKDVCDRKVVEKMVKDLMVERREEFARSTAEMAKLAKKSVSEGGSSYSNLERLIEDIKLTAKWNPIS
ncbi:UDP-glucuronosyl/UDP-glucosyltransferase [Trema orientale]|uniref:UDP-glucuronosyl/UDP-glucosyltransferase n=1 Tax=Trema orientale TaxID=63057 RepID=A0A2P5EPW0_TREOI|nr:UDP-glucuronosyl/UDP-glucosyltransferase [Trema orientale]